MTRNFLPLRRIIFPSTARTKFINGFKLIMFEGLRHSRDSLKKTILYFKDFLLKTKFRDLLRNILTLSIFELEKCFF